MLKWFHAECVGIPINTPSEELEKMQSFLCPKCMEFARKQPWAAKWMKAYAEQWDEIQKEYDEATMSIAKKRLKNLVEKQQK